ncbi:hypothetical protein Tco_0270871 [Tanacetum coccineum]
MVNHGIAIVAMSPCGVGFAGGDGFGRLGTVSKVYESDRGDGSFWVKAGKGGKIYSVLTSRVEFGKRAKVVPQRYKLLCNDRPCMFHIWSLGLIRSYTVSPFGLTLLALKGLTV